MKRRAIKKAGEYLAVLRPEDPVLALRLASAHVDRVNKAIADGAPMSPEAMKKDWNDVLAAQPYRYLGLLGEGRRILDRHGWSIGKLQRGDAFVAYSEVQRAARAVDVARGRTVPTDDAPAPTLESVEATEEDTAELDDELAPKRTS